MARRTEGEANTVNTINVPSIDEYVEKIKENGGSIIVPKHAVPGVGWTAYFTDPEGNSFGLMEDDPTAHIIFETRIVDRYNVLLFRS